jgi:hypothetical protein
MKRIIGACILSLFALGFLSSTTTPSRTFKPTPGVLFEIVANGEMAVALCYKRNSTSVFDEVLFKGPSGIKIRATQMNDANFMGNTTEFSHVGGKSSYKRSLATIFFKQNLPIPAIYTINGTVIPGIGDSGIEEAKLQEAVQKEYGKLPNDFQQGLREFYTYCARSNIGLSTISAPLRFAIGEQVEPFHVNQLINTDPLDIKAIETEFNCN